jgi:hypothetical protein
VSRTKKRTGARDGTPDTVSGHCLCGAVEIEIDYPAFWAWHDHSPASRRAHGAAYATYVGCWRKHVRIVKGEKAVRRFEDKTANATRSFCSRCGTPLVYARKRSPHMVNIPRALFDARTGREPRYHLNIEDMQDWTYTGEPLVPLKGYPGVVWERPKTKKKFAGLHDAPPSAGRRTVVTSSTAGAGASMHTIDDGSDE